MNIIHQKCAHHRAGMTWVDVLVMLCAITILIAVAAPAVNSSRRQNKKLECLNNMRNVGVAMQNLSASTNEKLPQLTRNLPTRTDADQEGQMLIGWPITLLPALDSTAVLRNIKRNAVAGSSPQSMATIADTEKVWLPYFTCPQDPNSFRKPGGLSFVVNAGFISRSLYHGDPEGLHRPGLLSWNGNDISDEEDDIKIGAATGVIWRSVESFQSSLDYVSAGDGTSCTLLLTENLQAGKWYDTDTTMISFGFPVAANGVQVPFGPGSWFESSERPLNTLFTGGMLTPAGQEEWQINRDLKAAPGTRPRPSSNHEGGVNVIMCDGSGRFLSEQIDRHVYLKLMTSRGAEFGEKELLRDSY